MEHTANNKKRLPLWLWLCYALLLLLVFTASSFAGYKTTASGWDSARVAAFRYDAAAAVNQPTAITLKPTDAEGMSYSFTVSNGKSGQVSEVAQKYAVLLSAQGETSEWLPDGVTVTVSDSTNSANGRWSAADQAYRFENAAWQFAAGQAGKKTCTMTFRSNSATATSTPISGITITVVFEQLD